MGWFGGFPIIFGNTHMSVLFKSIGHWFWVTFFHTSCEYDLVTVFHEHPGILHRIFTMSVEKGGVEKRKFFHMKVGFCNTVGTYSTRRLPILKPWPLSCSWSLVTWVWSGYSHRFLTCQARSPFKGGLQPHDAPFFGEVNLNSKKNWY